MVFSFKDLSKQFGYSWAVREASGEVRRGSKTAIVGKNGAGKSTLLYLLAGLYRPAKGRLDFSLKKNISFMGHENMFYSKLSALENLTFFQRLHPHIEKNDLMEALRFIGLYAARDEKVESFSHGMQKRLGIARVIAQKPSILILDEAFSGLDLGARRILRSIIESGGIPEKNWKFDALLLVEHDLELCLGSCSHFWIMQDGALTANLSKEDHSMKSLKENILRVLEKE